MPIALTAQSTPIENVYHYILKNGLELFIMENGIVPRTYIEVAVWGGGIAHTKETIGMPHLLEHMLLSGNSLYPTATTVEWAINDMGISNCNILTMVGNK